MKSSDIIRSINDLESAVPVDELADGGLRIWPLVRLGLYFKAAAADRAPAGSPGAPVPAAWPKRGLNFFADTLRRRRARSLDRTHDAALRPADVVFLGDGISFARIDGRWYDKFCDPLIALLRREGKTSFLMTPGHSCLVPRQSPSFFVQRDLDRVGFAARARFRIAGTPAAPLPGFPELIAHARRLGCGGLIPALEAVRWEAAQVRKLADYFRWVFRAVKPKIGFGVSYYGTAGMAFNLACREHGIPSVDIQHGMAGELCPPYGRWNRVPRHGYALLPSAFWCWSVSDAAAIDRWSAAVPRWHEAVVGGNPWLTECRREGSDLAREQDRLFTAAFPAGERDGRLILLTLQPGFADDRHLGAVLEAMRVSPPSWLWLVRLHPCMQNERSRVAALLGDRGLARFEFEQATDLPLYALLRHVDVHVTHSSATVVEAESFGVPSVVTSDYGAEFFQEQIVRGWACTARDPAGIVAAINEQLRRSDSPRGSGGPASADGRIALSRIIALSEAAAGDD